MVFQPSSHFRKAGDVSKQLPRPLVLGIILRTLPWPVTADLQCFFFFATRKQFLCYWFAQTSLQVTALVQVTKFFSLSLLVASQKVAFGQPLCCAFSLAKIRDSKVHFFLTGEAPIWKGEVRYFHSQRHSQASFIWVLLHLLVI